jgi:hypothetical protein
MKFLLLLALLISPAHAAEKVMFMVNMNYSPEELAAARKVAQSRRQELVLIPPEEDIRAGDKSGTMRANLIKEIKRAKGISDAEAGNILSTFFQYGPEGVADADIRRRFSEKAQKLKDTMISVIETEQKRGTIGQQINQKMAELKAAGKSVDTFIISAHSDGATLNGETSYMLDQASLGKLKSLHPELFSDPRHVMLLGCYTTTETSSLMWRELFPSVTMIAGFDGRAPSRKVAASANFITEVLGTADRLDRENMRRNDPLSAKAVRDALKGLESVRITASAIDYCTHRVEGLPGSKLNCDDQWITFTAMTQEIDRRFLNIEAPEEDPPRQSDGTVLRSYYNKIQGMCPPENSALVAADKKEEFKLARDELRDRVLRLLFWWNVQKNYGMFHQEKIKAFAEKLKSAGINEEIPKLDGNLGRKDFIKKIYQIINAIQAKDASIRAEYQSRKPLPEDADEAAKEQFRLETERLEKAYEENRKLMDSVSETYLPLMTLQKEGIPGNWIEPDTALSR